jgi:hypothetical protein
MKTYTRFCAQLANYLSQQEMFPTSEKNEKKTSYGQYTFFLFFRSVHVFKIIEQNGENATESLSDISQIDFKLGSL